MARRGYPVTALVFDCVGARAEPYAAVPTMTFRLNINETSGTPVHAIALRCQMRIEPRRRHYTPEEVQRLNDLFGDGSRWADTLNPVHFTTVTTMVPAFTGATGIDLPVPCTYDLEVASARYFNALDGDAVPLLLLFSGSVFSRAENGFTVEPVPWSAECAYRLPVSVWRDMVDRYFPGSAWLRMRRETFDALSRYKTANALPTWDATLGALLAEREAAR
jgi:Family of unknown function (DUF6084)